MYRLLLSFLCSFAFAFQVLLITGCGGSTKTTPAGGSGNGPTSGSGSSSGSGATPLADSAACSPGGPFAGYGYTNQAGTITGIAITSPLPGENPSSVVVNATAYTTAAITQWTVCLDDKAAYQSNDSATSISQAITMNAGQHLLWAYVKDAAGDSSRSEVRLIQVGPPLPSSSVLPTPPANAQVLTQMQNTSADWSICSLCAAGTHDTNNYSMTFNQKQPSLSGSSLEMYGAGPPWTNVLFKDIIMGTTSNKHFIWDFWVYHDPAVESNFWSSEMDFYVVLSGKEFMIGTQCDFGDGYWATWDSLGDRWLLNGIPCPHWTPGWHHVQWYMEIVSPTQYRYDTLVFDGTGYGINQTWTVNSTDWKDQLGLQYQLDQDATGTPLHEWTDNVNLTMW
jgi:hypothetical protein